MEKSPRSEHRARLIREMARDLDKSRRPSTSNSSKALRSNASAETTTSGFDPENEALMSTRQLDNTTQQLPELRASAQKYARYTRPEEPSYVIDTSAMIRAFPDFTQAGTSSDDDSMSIEVGRGVKDGGNAAIDNPIRTREYSINEAPGGSSFELSPPMIGNYQAMYTPPRKSKPWSKKESGAAQGSLKSAVQSRQASALEKQAVGASTPLTKTTDYGSAGSRHASEEHRRNLAAIHARVTEENDTTHITDDRPPTLNLTARNTRFGSGQGVQPSVSATLPTKFSSTQGFNQIVSQGVAKAEKLVQPHLENGTISSHLNPGTQQSFILPDLPNLSELVSGVFQDGTPVFSRHTKPRASRFAAATQHLSNKKNELDYAGVADIPVPEDEQAIFVSLKLLQDKVAELENNRAETDVTMKDLHQKNQILEHEKQETRRWRRSDSALGTTDGSDGGEESTKAPRTWKIEKSRLEANIQALQQQLEAANRKVSVSEITIRNLTQERDAAVSQLGVAFFTTEQLKAENEGLRDENLKLEAELAHAKAGHADLSQKWQRREEGLRKKIQRRDATVQSLREITQTAEVSQTQEEDPIQVKFIGKSVNYKTSKGVRTDEDCQVLEKENMSIPFADLRSRSTNPNQLQAPQLQPEQAVLTSRKTVNMQDPSEHPISIRNGKAMVDDTIDSGISDESANEPEDSFVLNNRPRAHSRSGKAKKDDESVDLTFLSFTDNGEIAKLRKVLEQERLARKQKRAASGTKSKSSGDFLHVDRSHVAPEVVEPSLPRKSSMKDSTARVEDRANTTVHSHQGPSNTLHSEEFNVQHRRHSEDSLPIQHNCRQGLKMENMTSAFIIPDITMQVPNGDKDLPTNLSTAAQQVFDGLAPHNGLNCTICKRLIEQGTIHEHNEAVKKTVKIPKPVPVSERMLEATSYEEEPTMRPSQPPALALATVMKGLEDELAHLKLQLSQYQTLYNRHDPSLSKRRRKSVHQKIESLLQAVDVKSDQIYALYDVLEGQKTNGHEMNDQEIEVTLQSIGVEIGNLNLRGGDVPVENGQTEARRAWEDTGSSDESEEESMWKGIEETAETMKSGRAETRRSSWGL